MPFILFVQFRQASKIKGFQTDDDDDDAKQHETNGQKFIFIRLERNEFQSFLM